MAPCFEADQGPELEAPGPFVIKNRLQLHSGSAQAARSPLWPAPPGQQGAVDLERGDNTPPLTRLSLPHRDQQSTIVSITADTQLKNT